MKHVRIRFHGYQNRNSKTVFLLSAARQETWEDSDLFKPEPASDVDALGKKRYVGEQERVRYTEEQRSALYLT